MRRVVILERAVEDMERAREFYDAQEWGIGDYLFPSRRVLNISHFHRAKATVLMKAKSWAPKELTARSR